MRCIPWGGGGLGGGCFTAVMAFFWSTARQRSVTSSFFCTDEMFWASHLAMIVRDVWTQPIRPASFTDSIMSRSPAHLIPYLYRRLPNISLKRSSLTRRSQLDRVHVWSCTHIVAIILEFPSINVRSCLHEQCIDGSVMREVASYLRLRQMYLCMLQLWQFDIVYIA